MPAPISSLHSSQDEERAKLAILVNTLSPARVPLFNGLASCFDLLVLHGGNESNRDSWHDIERSISGASVKKAWGWQIRLTRRLNGRSFDHRYLHITPGYIWHLVLFRPDVVVANEMGLRTLIALAYGTLFRKPVWVWWGGTAHTERGIGTAKQLMRRLIVNWANHWISYGQSSTEYLERLGARRTNIVEIQNSVDERRFAPREKTAEPFLQRPVVLHVGQFTPRKGIGPLLRAAAALQSEGHQFSLVLVGSGPERFGAQGLARELRLQHVYFEAPRDPADMPSVYRSADMLVFPTLEDVWGLVANEAVLIGLPVLCSKYAGCARELFTDESIFDPGNPEEFVAKLRVAISGKLPRPDASRLRSTPQLLRILVTALRSSLPARAVAFTDRQSDIAP